MKGKPGRHVPAFVLLVLAKGPSYGLQILNDLKANMPFCHLDSAAVYRALNSLEADNCVESYSENLLTGGIIKKIYKITPHGLEELDKMQIEINKRMQNLKFFLDTYNGLERSV